MISFVKVNWLLIRMVLMVIGGVIGYMVGFELYVVFIFGDLFWMKLRELFGEIYGD